ncbi:hypothetical protein JXB31_01550 [Candidatus Woesearchaeota archaeon]|nr:hypothetical protein [Candidatus Woesearchaeota archaeon]
MRGKLLPLFALMLAVMAAGIVFAATGENAGTDVGSTGQLTEGPATPGQAVAQGGNVTRVDVESNASATKWQGFYGNVSGNVRLGLTTNTFYDFGSSDIIAVYAARDQNFDFASMSNALAQNVSTAFGLTGVENSTAVYTNVLSIDGLVNTPSTALEDGNFNTYIVDDGNDAAINDFAFGGEVQNTGAAGFDGVHYEYELLVPVEAGTPTYYFFMSI